MKYLCSIYASEKAMEAMSQAELDILGGECLAYDALLRERGCCLTSEALQPVETATTVRVRNGRVSVTDGPFAETKEQLGGFYLIDVRDLNEAIQVVSQIPAARFGSIEVRPIRT